MTITPAELARLASLAALDVPADQLPALAAEVDRIISYVGQLAGPGPNGPSAAERSPGCRLRADTVRQIPMAGSPADLAPEWLDGFFVVPRSPIPGPE